LNFFSALAGKAELSDGRDQVKFQAGLLIDRGWRVCIYASSGSGVMLFIIRHINGNYPCAGCDLSRIGEAMRDNHRYFPRWFRNIILPLAIRAD